MAWHSNNNARYSGHQPNNHDDVYVWLAPIQTHIDNRSRNKRIMDVGRTLYNITNECAHSEQHHVLLPLPAITRSPHRTLDREESFRMSPAHVHLSSDIVFNVNPLGQKRRTLPFQRDPPNNQYEHHTEYQRPHISQERDHFQYHSQHTAYEDHRHTHQPHERSWQRTEYEVERELPPCVKTQHHGRKGSLAFILDEKEPSTEYQNNQVLPRYSPTVFKRESLGHKYERQMSLESQKSPSTMNESTGSECSIDVQEEKATPSHGSSIQHHVGIRGAITTDHTISPAQPNLTRSGKTIVKKSRICKVEDCTRYVVNRGLCIGHGGGKRCAVGGCTSSAKNLGVCWKHGGSTKCTIADCENRAKSRGVCWSHGGGRKCKSDACEKTAVSNGLCWAHGGGKRCIVAGCKKPAYERNGNVCNTHQITN